MNIIFISLKRDKFQLLGQDTSHIRGYVIIRTTEIDHIKHLLPPRHPLKLCSENIYMKICSLNDGVCTNIIHAPKIYFASALLFNLAHCCYAANILTTSILSHAYSLLHSNSSTYYICDNTYSYIRHRLFFSFHEAK